MEQFTEVERLIEIIKHFEILWKTEKDKNEFLEKENEKLQKIVKYHERERDEELLKTELQMRAEMESE